MPSSEMSDKLDHVNAENKMVNVQSAIRKTFLSRGIVRLLGGE